MNSLDSLRRDCRHFRTDRPCTPHKLRGKVCADCDEYAPAGRRVAIVKLAAAGDVLRTTSFLPGLRAMYPDAWFSWVTAPGALAFFEGIDFGLSGIGHDFRHVRLSPDGCRPCVGV